MEETQSSIPQATLKTLARSFFKETVEYGFQQVDYVRFVNHLLDHALGTDGKQTPSDDSDQSDAAEATPDIPLRQLPVYGEQLRIVAFDPGQHLPLLESWMNDSGGSKFLLSRVTARVSSLHQLTEDPQTRMGMICLNSGKIVGAMAFLDFDGDQKKAELRKLIGENRYRGRGLAKEATRLWIRYGRDVLELKKIYLNTLQTNIRNIRLNEELGFYVEGILRNEIYFDGAYRDVLRMGMCFE